MPLALAEGRHLIRFDHDWYQPVDRTIDVDAGPADAATALAVDFEAQHVPLKPGKTKPE
jgi:hypothetical protein